MAYRDISFLVQGKMWVVDPLKSTGAKKAVQIGISLWTLGDIDDQAFPLLFGAGWT